MRNWLLLFLIPLAAACSLPDILNATIPRDGYVIHRDIAYGPMPEQRLDVYVPAGATHAPVLVFFYGGSWQKGSKKDYRFLGQAFASQGFITAIVDYRLYPNVRFPSFIEDAALATTYMHQHAATYGGDAGALFVAGHSAGAYLALMVGGDPAYMGKAGGNREWIRGIIGIAGPYDFLPLTDDTLKIIFATAPEAETQPINHMIGNVPAVFLATGDADDTVDPRNSIRLQSKLLKMKRPVQLHTYTGVGHIGIILALAEGFRSKAPLLEDIAHFVRATAPRAD